MDTKQKHTDQKLLVKGLKWLVVGLVMIVVSTYLFTFAFLNKEILPLYILLPLAIIAMAVTIFLLFKGIRTLVKALF